MKKYIFIILTLHLFFIDSNLSAQGQDLVVTTNSIIYQNGQCNDGSIHFDMTNAPFAANISVLSTPSPQCLSPFWTIDLFSTHTLAIPCDKECAGRYCFQADVLFGPPCTIEFCVDILYCIKDDSPSDPGGSQLYTGCFGPLPDYIGGGNDIIYAAGYSEIIGIDELNSEYRFYTNMGTTQLEDIKDNMYRSISEVVTEFNETGSSIYQVSSQSEVDLDEDYVFKFDQNGDVVWVYHTGKSLTSNKNYNDHKVKPLDINMNSSQSQVLSDHRIQMISIYPNPFSNNQINIKMDANAKHEIQVSLTDLLGRKIKEESYNLSNGENRITLNLDQEIPNGIYSLTISDLSEIIYSQPIIHNKE